MILLVESAEYMGKYTLLCTFNNGERRKVDLAPLLKYPAFEELKDESNTMLRYESLIRTISIKS